MDIKTGNKDGLFFLVCLGLGVLAEICFLHGKIGVSYLVFIIGFYTVLFMRIGLEFNHRRIGLLFMASIWLLSSTFLFFDSTLFYTLNLLLIPILILAHIVLITSPNTFKWNTPTFLLMLIDKVRVACKYNFKAGKKRNAYIQKRMQHQLSKTMKRVVFGILIGLPLLFIIIILLMSADDVFKNVVLYIPEKFLNVNVISLLFRPVFVLLFTLCFFGIFQVLKRPSEINISKQKNRMKQLHVSSVTAVTVLTMLSCVYLLFVIIQFHYFFGSGLLNGMTYATYARKGFAELLIVLLINWTILITCLKLVHERRKKVKWVLNVYYSVLIIVSGVMLTSAYQRLSLYEAAYGYTMERILAHAFMIFLLFIFAYTFIRVWMERISILHFYLIMGLIFYTVLNVINLEQMIVDENLKRFEETGKIDIHYLQTLSYTGMEGLIEVYKQEDVTKYDEEIERYLAVEIERMNDEQEPNWQSFNFVRQNVEAKLNQLNLDERIISEIGSSTDYYNEYQ